MDKLPDYLTPGLRVVFCGTASGDRSAAVGGYYAGQGNEFWGTLYEAGFMPEPLGPHLSARVLEFGIGLTDLAKEVAQSHDRGLGTKYDIPRFLSSIGRYTPTWVAFHGKEAAQEVSAYLGHGRKLDLGRQTWAVAKSKVFVLPNMSGSNRRKSYDGKPSREAWFRELAGALPRLKP